MSFLKINQREFFQNQPKFEPFIHQKLFCSNSFETSDGQSRQEEAVLNNAGTENESLSVKGSYSFVADDGQTYTVSFIKLEYLENFLKIKKKWYK